MEGVEALALITESWITFELRDPFIEFCVHTFRENISVLRKLNSAKITVEVTAQISSVAGVCGRLLMSVEMFILLSETIDTKAVSCGLQHILRRSCLVFSSFLDFSDEKRCRVFEK